MPEAMLLTEWPKFMDLQMKMAMAQAGDAALLVEMGKMCPGQPATSEEIEEISRETPFHTPCWKGQKVDTDIPDRLLSPAEVDVINRKYLELKAAFDAKRASQSPTESINRAEDRLTAQAAANTGEITSEIRQVQAMQQQILDKLDTGKRKGKGKGREDKVQVQRRADIKDGPEDVLVLYFDEDISQYVYEDQAGGQKYPVAKENVQFKELRNAKVHILETEGVTKQTAAKYAKYKNLKGLIISDPDPKKEIILDPETEIEVQLTNKYVTRIPWKFIKLLPIHGVMEDALSAAEPKTYRITSEKDSYHDFIGSGTLINAETVKLTLRGLNLEYVIPLANVQEVSEDAVGKFDVGSKLQLSGSITRGPLKRFKGSTAAITSWAGDKVMLQFQPLYCIFIECLRALL